MTGAGVKDFALGTATLLVTAAIVYVGWRVYKTGAAVGAVVSDAIDAVSDRAAKVAGGVGVGPDATRQRIEQLKGERARLQARLEAEQQSGLRGTIVDELQSRVDAISDELRSLGALPGASREDMVQAALGVRDGGY